MPNNGWLPLFPALPAPRAFEPWSGNRDGFHCVRCGSQDSAACGLVKKSGHIYQCCPLHPEQWAAGQGAETAEGPKS